MAMRWVFFQDDRDEMGLRRAPVGGEGDEMGLRRDLLGKGGAGGRWGRSFGGRLPVVLGVPCDTLRRDGSPTTRLRAPIDGRDPAASSHSEGAGRANRRADPRDLSP